jgi:hypothetical protein
MGCFDTIRVDCPSGDRGVIEFQTKGGPCTLSVYGLGDAPFDVLADVNRHSPNQCSICGQGYWVNRETRQLVDYRKDVDRSDKYRNQPTPPEEDPNA